MAKQVLTDEKTANRGCGLKCIPTETTCKPISCLYWEQFLSMCLQCAHTGLGRIPASGVPTEWGEEEEEGVPRMDKSQTEVVFAGSKARSCWHHRDRSPGRPLS